MIDKADSAIVLSIGIPTFNGAKHIAHAINSVLVQITENLGKEVELLIHDNCSTDGTNIICSEYAQKYPEVIRYFRNGENIGFDANINLIVKNARSNFVWFLSDDDFMMDRVINRAINVIKNNPDYALIFANYNSAVSLSFRTDILCENGNIFFSRSKFKNGLISSNIINKKIWNDLNIEKYIGCSWIHFAYAIEALAPIRGKKGYIIINEGIKTGEGSRWINGGKFIYTGLQLVKIFKLMEALGYSKNIKKKADYIIKGGYKRSIPFAIKNGLKVDKLLLNEMIHCYWKYLSFWIFDLPLLTVPSFIYKYLYNILKKAKIFSTKTGQGV